MVDYISSMFTIFKVCCTECTCQLVNDESCLVHSRAKNPSGGHGVLCMLEGLARSYTVGIN